MTIKDRIIADRLLARTSKDNERVTLLGVVLGEMERVGKTTTDEEALRILKKMVENAKECNNLQEVKLLSIYLPQMFSEDDLDKLISLYCAERNLTEKKSMGEVMKYLKEKYSGRYDGKLASQIVSKILK
jgi:uncharacterized protein YqeY